jgi:hypothetical protein
MKKESFFLNLGDRLKVSLHCRCEQLPILVVRMGQSRSDCEPGHLCQDCLWGPLTFCIIGTTVSFPGDKGARVDPIFPYRAVPSYIMCGALPPLPKCLYGVVHKHRIKFTFKDIWVGGCNGLSFSQQY